MKIFTQNSIKTLINLKCFLASFLMITLIIPITAMSQSSPAPVNLGTAGNLVVLAKTGISTTGTTSIVGDIGVSPNNATSITGFGLVLDASGKFATSSLVNGRIYAAGYAAPTPTLMTAAVIDMETAYTDAAGRAPDYTELHAGDLTGKTLTRGVYKWSSGVLISAGGVTLSGSSTDVWIFEIAQNLTVANGAIIHLSGGALASNIFWQVAGQATIGTTSNFSGIILCQTQIDIQTGSSFNGKALAQTAVSLDGNGINTGTVGINDQSLGNGIAMYPNPVQNNLTITNTTNIKLDQLAVYDVSGRLIHTIDLRDMQQEITLDMSKLSSGVYMLEIIGDKARTMKRWIKS